MTEKFLYVPYIYVLLEKQSGEGMSKHVRSNVNIALGGFGVFVYNGQTSGDYIYCIGFGWVFNEGGGGEGSVNYEMYCNGNKIGYFG